MSRIMPLAQIEEAVGKPSSMVHAKTIDHIDPGARAWIGAATVMVASLANADGVHIMLGGGPPGWAGGEGRWLDLPVTMLDGVPRLAVGAAFGSVFLVPSLREAIRINGRLVTGGAGTVRVEVDECYIHCGKAIIRSDFWGPAPAGAIGDTLADLATQCRFLGLGTVDARGHADLSPKGDPAGLTVRTDGRSLWFADRPGNRRIDSFRNIVTQPRVALALLIPGRNEVAIVTGVATIGDDPALRGCFAVDGKIPDLVTTIAQIGVERYESAALARSAPWRTEPHPVGLSAGKIAAGHLKLAAGLGARLAGTIMSVPGLIERELAKDYRKNLY